MDRTIDAVRERAAEIDLRLADLEATAKLLRDERDELRAFVRVYERFADDRGFASEGSEPNLATRMVTVDAEPIIEIGRSVTTKPEGKPTVPEMIFEALAAADVLGEPGLRPKEIIAYIRQKHWPDAPSDSIGPIVWRMWAKEKRLDKVGDLYSLKPDPSGQLFHHRSGDSQEGSSV